jgi:ATP-dependent DNA ligase
MQHETLYKRTKTGAIQYWTIEAKPDDGSSIIRKESGQLGTKSPTVHLEEITQGKNIGRANETTHIEQARFQAESDWKKKHDEGYKTLKDLGIIACTEPALVGLYQYPNCGILYKNLVNSLNNTLPQFNTDASGNIKPMLATDWKKIKKIEYPLYCEPKLDGVRCLMIVRKDETGTPIVTFLSRTGKEYTTLDHIRDDVYTYAFGFDKEFILDGEIYSDELTFQEIVSAVKAQKPNSLKLHFRAYDIVNDEIQQHRRNDLKPLVEAIGSEFIQHIPWYVATSAEDVKEFHDRFVSRGNEGAILRCFDGKYAQGQRSRELMKVKEFNSEEFAFKNFEFGQRGVEDLIAVLWTADGQSEFRAKMVGTAAQKEKLYNEKDQNEGAAMTVKFFGYTEGGAGIPRFPIGVAFRSYE